MLVKISVTECISNTLLCFQLDLSSMQRYVSPVNPSVYPHLSVVLLAIGLFFTAWDAAHNNSLELRLFL